MSTSATHPNGTSAGGADASAPVVEALRLFARGVRAHQLYLPNNPMHVRALEAMQAALAALWQEMDVLVIDVTDTQFSWEGRTVLEEPGRGAESLPWLFYKDGIRSLELRPGFEGRDLRVLLDIVQRARTRGEEEDLLTMFWEHEFAHFGYKHIDLAAEGSGAPGAELLERAAPTGTLGAPIDRGADGGTQDGSEAGDTTGGAGSSSPDAQFARIDDFDATLYFLEEAEIQYLRRAIHDDFATDIRPSVVAALYDIFEREDDPTVREEICGILEGFLLLLLANLEFRTAAYLLREASVAAERAQGVIPLHRERLLGLGEKMSEPTVIGQLLDALEHMSLKPPQTDLNTLLTALRPGALAPLLAHLARTQNSELRAVMEAATTRLAASSTAELVRLVESETDAIALEAVRRCGALKSTAAVAPLARVLSERSEALRRAAVTALAEIGSPGAMQSMEGALDDEDVDIRLVAIKTVCERQQRTALPRIERRLRENVIPGPTTAAERSAVFDAYAQLGGESSVSLLDSLLNPKGFLSRKEETATRASAATALGKVGTPAALESLRKASNDKDVVVRSAAARALRGGA